MRIVLLGSPGAGKTTMATEIIRETNIAFLPLDWLAWQESGERKPLAESLGILREFIAANDQWVIEGCYGDLVEAALPHCTELRFLNPGVETCVAHCLRRPFESVKFPTPAEQQAALATLVQHVREYETRTDEYGLPWHRRIYDGFGGAKREYNSLAAYPEGLVKAG